MRWQFFIISHIIMSGCAGNIKKHLFCRPTNEQRVQWMIDSMFCMEYCIIERKYGFQEREKES